MLVSKITTFRFYRNAHYAKKIIRTLQVKSVALEIQSL